jgi:Delta7-sterol 5-desaturase
MSFFLTTLYMFLGIFGRYLLVSLLFHYIIKVKFKKYFAPREINNRQRMANQEYQEIGYSLITSLIFAVSGAGIFWAWQEGYTKIYLDWQQYSWLWYGVSIGLVLFIHETYYYWLHRWMHLPGVYRWVHKVHHQSITTSAWTSFSFHPIESMLQAVVIPIIIFIIPLHFSALALILLTMTITSVINHLNTEIYPKDFDKHWFGRWWIGATHHSLHHSQFKYNFGLYFTFWDQWMHTESPQYRPLSKQKVKKNAKND